MKTHQLIFASALLIFASCEEKTDVETFAEKGYHYGSKSDSAVFYFNKGWAYIMDYGQWTLSEEAFRKAVELDSSFLVGKSLVGKITKNHHERVRLFEEVNDKMQSASRDDQLLLEITLKTLELFNARDQKIELEPEFVSDFYDLSEKNFRHFVHKYPDESYMKAEYIEVLNAKYGPKRALDSLDLLCSEGQKDLPFFISYAASMESDLGDFKSALAKADRLNTFINNPQIPAPFVLYAQIYSNMDSLKLAKFNIDKAIQLDTNHIIARRLKTDIESRLELK